MSDPLPGPDRAALDQSSDQPTAASRPHSPPLGATANPDPALGDPHAYESPHAPEGSPSAFQEQWADEFDELPRRARRRFVTPLNAGLLAVLLVACGFVGGVLVEKGQTSSSASSIAGLGRRAFAGGAAAGGAAAGRGPNATGGAGAAAANATVGTVSNIRGHTLYVTDAQGNLVAVRAASGAKVTKTNTASVSAIRPGDSVIVTGARGANGTLNATAIRATSPDAGGGGIGGGALAALFGAGGFGGRGGSAAGAGGAAAGAPTGAGGGIEQGGGGNAGPALFGKG